MPHATLDLTGRHVVITGGAGALGTPVVSRFVAAGATCIVPCIDDGPGPRGLPGVRYLPRVELTDERAVASLYADLPDLWASVHLAGGFVWAKLGDTTAQTARAQFEMNCVTALLCCREAVKKMRASGSDEGGRIVNVASRGALHPAPGLAAYAMAKAAVVALTQALANELRGEHILVNAVAPSLIDTPANRAAMPDADHDKWAKPAEIAETILFLASPSNALTTGSIVHVEGREL
ncbi:MAG: SDR family oxidoreductase [Myxococcales bacterium]|nr:SDR family oxidoreductase [Myxococcales bacterium]